MIALFAAFLMLCTSNDRLQAQESPRFQIVPEGTLDNETGLIWGFDAFSTLGGGGTWDWAVSDGKWLYAAALEYYTAQNYGEENAVYNEDWRLPTVDQYVDAIQAGLFDYHNLDPNNHLDSKIDPLAPNQNYRYTSDTVRGKDVYGVNWWTADVTVMAKNSAVNFLYVRAGNPEPDGTGNGGKGKGGGKNR